MTNTTLLREKIDESGYKLRFVAKKIGITYQGFLKKINNESEFKASEIQGLKELLNLTDEERDKFTKLLASGMTDSFRYVYPDLTGAYSWWSYRGRARENNAGWRIDYFLVSECLKANIDKAFICSEIMGSDHCPVGLDLKW